MFSSSDDGSGDMMFIRIPKALDTQEFSKEMYDWVKEIIK